MSCVLSSQFTIAHTTIRQSDDAEQMYVKGGANCDSAPPPIGKSLPMPRRMGEIEELGILAPTNLKSWRRHVKDLIKALTVGLTVSALGRTIRVTNE